MGLEQAQADGPGPGAVATQNPVTVAGQQYTVETAVASMLASRWRTTPSLAKVCDTRLNSDFQNVEGSWHGDTITIKVIDRFRKRTGRTFDAQPKQTRSVVMALGEPFGVDERIDMWTEQLYLASPEQREREMRKLDTMIEIVEDLIATTFKDAYYYGLTSTAGTGATIAAASVGEDSAPAPGTRPADTAYPRGKAFTRLQADLIRRGIGDREFCALMDPTTHASMAEAVQDAPYTTPMGQDAYRTGQLVGASKFGWMSKISQLNGTQRFGTYTGAGTINSAADNGDEMVDLRAVAGNTFTKGTRIQFEDVGNIREIRATTAGGRASFVVNADTTTTGTNHDIPLTRPIRFTDTGEEGRRKTCASQPMANKKFYINGLDQSVSNNRSILNGKEFELSYFMARNTAMLAFIKGVLPQKGEGIGATGRMISSDAYKVAFSMIRYFDGNEAERKWRLDGRTGHVVHEPEGGWVVTGEEVG